MFFERKRMLKKGSGGVGGPRRRKIHACAMYDAKVEKRAATADVAYIYIYNYNLERSCYMILEVGIARHRLWRHVLACGAHTCMPIPLEVIITALYCSKAVILYMVDDAYSI